MLCFVEHKTKRNKVTVKSHKMSKRLYSSAAVTGLFLYLLFKLFFLKKGILFENFILWMFNFIIFIYKVC